jgi:hypothetical protein
MIIPVGDDPKLDLIAKSQSILQPVQSSLQVIAVLAEKSPDCQMPHWFWSACARMIIDLVAGVGYGSNMLILMTAVIIIIIITNIIVIIATVIFRQLAQTSRLVRGKQGRAQVSYTRR